MNSLKKTVACIFMFSPIVAFSTSAVSAQYPDESLESYLKNYHPETYRTAQEKKIDLQSMEFSEANINNVNLKEAISIVRPDPDIPINARALCEKGNPTGAPGIFLENNFIATCVSADGTFGNGRQSLGMTFNPTGTGTVQTPDYLKPGTPHEYFSVSVNSVLFSNNNRNGPDVTGGDNIPTQIHRLDRYSNLQEGGVLVKSTVTHQNSHLDITQKYTLDPNSREIIIRVEIKNSGDVVLNDIAYARGMDPDQDRPSGSFSTINRKGHTYYGPFPAQPIHVEPQNIAWASGKNSKLSIALYSVDPVYHDTCISNMWTTNPIDILNQSCNGGAGQPIYDIPGSSFSSLNYSDSTINIAFKIGQLKPKETAVFSFKYLFDQEKKRIKPILEEPLLPARSLR